MSDTPQDLPTILLRKRIVEFAIFIIVAFAVCFTMIIFSMVNGDSRDKELQQYINDKLKTEYQGLEAQRKELADSMRIYRLEIKSGELRDQERSQRMTDQEKQLTQIRQKYEAIERLHHYDVYTADSIKRDFSKEFGN